MSFWADLPEKIGLRSLGRLGACGPEEALGQSGTGAGGVVETVDALDEKDVAPATRNRALRDTWRLSETMLYF